MYAHTEHTPPLQRNTISPGSDSGRESAAPLEVVYSGSESEPGSVSYQYDNARKRAIRMANQNSMDGKILEEPQQNGQEDAFGRSRGPAVGWTNAAPTAQMTPAQQPPSALPEQIKYASSAEMNSQNTPRRAAEAVGWNNNPPAAQMTPAQQPPAVLPDQMKYVSSADITSQNASRRGTNQSSVIVESDSGIDWVAERKKDREERMLERTEREQERSQRRREMDERAQERQERKKERDERALEREERRREKEEHMRLKNTANGVGMDYTANTQKMHDLERANAALSSELDGVKAELRAIKEAMQAEQEKTNSLVQYMKLFQFPDEREINVNKLRNLVACAQQKVATIVNLKSANWWMALGPSQSTHDRYEKAVALLGNRRFDGIATSLFQCEPAMAYVVEYHSRLGIQRNQDYTVFGWFSREVYLQAWNSLSKIGDDMGRIEPAALHALIDFVCTEVLKSTSQSRDHLEIRRRKSKFRLASVSS